MKIRAPFIGYPSPSFGFWHLFARQGAKFLQHVLSIDDEKECFNIGNNLTAPHRYQLEDVERWSDWRSRV